MILMIDNFCSFTYNIVQYFRQLGQTVSVCYNNDLDLAQIAKLSPKAIVLGPGPCTPDDAGISLPILQHIDDIPILGVCLGHQAIGQAFGGRIIKTATMHGRVSSIYHHGTGVFDNLPTPFLATRYHSLVIDKNDLPDDLIISAWTQIHPNNQQIDEIMGVFHHKLPIHGVQFHPESILSEQGFALLNNFLKQYGLSKLTDDELPIVS